jgi:preprotein translocase subunit SecG
MKSVTISFAILGSLFIVAGIVMTVLYCKNKKKEQRDSSDESREELIRGGANRQ